MPIGTKTAAAVKLAEAENTWQDCLRFQASESLKLG